MRFSSLLPLYITLSVYPALSLATTYRFNTLDAPTATQGTVAYGINNLGQVVGTFYDTRGAHGFVYDGQRYLILDVPNAEQTFAYGINNQGYIVGNYLDTSGKHGFVYFQGSYTTLDNPNGAETNAFSINNQGQVAGNFRLGTTGVYGYVYALNARTYTTINNPKASAGNTSVTGINDAQELVGFYYNNGAHGFSYANQTFHTHDAPQAGAAGTLIYGLNNYGLMVGLYYNTKSVANSFVYDGSFTPLAIPSSKMTLANDINDLGQVIGYFTDTKGSHGFIAAPVFAPEVHTQLTFRHLASSYSAGETVNIELQEHSLVRTQSLDLWVAIQLPNQELRYIDSQVPGLLSTLPKPFKTNVSPAQTQHSVARFDIPKGLSGRYTLYATFTTPGTELSNLMQNLRANIAKASVTLR